MYLTLLLNKGSIVHYYTYTIKCYYIIIPVVLDCCNELASTGIDISLGMNVPYTNCDGSTVDDAVDSVRKRLLVVAKYSSVATLWWKPQNAQRHITNRFFDRHYVCMFCWPEVFLGANFVTWKFYGHLLVEQVDNAFVMRIDPIKYQRDAKVLWL